MRCSSMDGDQAKESDSLPGSFECKTPRKQEKEKNRSGKTERKGTRRAKLRDKKDRVSRRGSSGHQTPGTRLSHFTVVPSACSGPLWGSAGALK